MANKAVNRSRRSRGFLNHSFLAAARLPQSLFGLRCCELAISPAPLVDAIDATLGSVLVLENGERVSVDVSVSVLDDYLCQYGHPCIAELCASGNTLVYWINVRMSETQWIKISSILQRSPSAAQLQACPEIADQLNLPYADIVRLPRRVYGGVGSPSPGVPPTLYTMPPVDFRVDDNTVAPWYLPSKRKVWYYGLLSARGWRVFKTFVNVRTGSVKTEGGVLENHFIEPRSPNNQRMNESGG